MKRFSMTIGAGLAAIALGVSGCTTAEPGGEGQGNEIAIGALTPITGAGAVYGPRMQKAMEMAVEEVNNIAAPLDRGLKLYSEDSETNPDSAVRAAQKLLSINNVEAILGTYSSAETLAVIPIVVQADAVLMHTSGSNDLANAKREGRVWAFQPYAKYLGKAAAAFVGEQGWVTTATVASNNPSGTSNQESFEEFFDGEVLESLLIAPNQSSYTSEIRKLQATDADIAYASAYPAELAVLVREAATAGADMNWMTQSFAINSAFIDAVGDDLAEGVYGVDTAPNLESPAYKRFLEEFTESTGDDLSQADTYVYMAYDMVITLSLAMTDCGCTGGDELQESILLISNPDGTDVFTYEEGIAELKAGNEINYQGASSNLDFDQEGQQIPNFGIYQVRSGALKLEHTVEVAR